METVSKNRQDIKPIANETMQMVEGVAFDCLQSTMAEAFKHGGMANLVPFLDRFLHQLETYAQQCCWRGWDEQLQRAVVSSQLATEYLPKARAAMDAYRDSRGDFQRRMATWDSMLSKVSAEDRGFVESIKEADSILATLLSSKADQDRAEAQRVAELARQTRTFNGSRRCVR